MWSGEINEYFKQNIRLIQSMCIKHEITATLINEKLVLERPGIFIDLERPETWKYYKNISGIYHETDTPIVINSFDTQKPIIFNAKNLAIHGNTRKEFDIGTSSFYRLVEQYPDYESVIIGSLYPANLTEAVNSKDLTILAYNKDLLEPQEVTLIGQLQDFIWRFDSRWNVRSFVSSDELYPAAQYAVLVSNIVQKLINLRLFNAKSSEAHSFHLTKYLEGHYGLHKYIDYMTSSQVLWLYRNIRYIERNIGKQETFKTLVKELIEARNLLPIYNISAKTLYSTNNDRSIDLTIKRKSIGSEVVNASEVTYSSLDGLLDLVRDESKGNADYIDTYKSSIKEKLSLSRNSNIITKDILSDLVDYSNASPFTKLDMSFKHWVYSVNVDGYYNPYFNLFNTIDDREYYLSSKESLVYFLYLTTRYVGSESDEIPAIQTFNRIKQSPPSVDDILSLIPFERRDDLRPLAEQIVVRAPLIRPMLLPRDLYSLSKKVYDYAMWQWFTISNVHDLYDRSYVAVMCSFMFDNENTIVDIPETTFSEFLTRTGLPEYLPDSYDLIGKLCYDIFSANTGYSLDDTDLLSNVQKMILEVFKLLSSYNIQLVSRISSGRIDPLNWPGLRIGNILVGINSELRMIVGPTSVSTKGTGESSTFLDLTKLVPLTNIKLSSLEKDLTMDKGLIYDQNTSWVTDSNLWLYNKVETTEPYDKYLQTLTSSQMDDVLYTIT